ncbi:MAG TPA: PEP-CTERM sorting domain-containing protein [Blastocatellia bacterium]|nr:PEP-CTERM sorting domain-containing protein [Blastocatellia bacterium]
MPIGIRVIPRPRVFAVARTQFENIVIALRKVLLRFVRSYRRHTVVGASTWNLKGWFLTLRSALQIVFCVCALTEAAGAIYGGPIGESSFTNPTIINFDNLVGGDCNLCGPAVTNQYAALGVTFNNPSHPDEDTADTNLVPLFPLASAPNALFVEQSGLIGEPAAEPFQILFSVPVTMVGFDYGSSVDSFLQVSAYGTGGQLLEALTFQGATAPIGLEGFAGIEEISPMAELDLSYIPYSDETRTFNFSIDNLEFQGPTVPEPASLFLVLAGLFGVALAQGSRNRRRRLPVKALRPPCQRQKV